jgi:hypothetical protein
LNGFERKIIFEGLVVLSLIFSCGYFLTFVINLSLVLLYIYKSEHGQNYWALKNEWANWMEWEKVFEQS